MMKSSSMVIVTSTLLLSSLMAISSANWLCLWASMELNMLSFLPFLMSSSSYQENEAATKYFLAQAIGSSLLLFSSFSLWFTSSLKAYMMIMLMVAILLKLGSFPCHFWFPQVMAATNWMSCLILSTWQKLAPLSILIFILNTENMIMLTVVAGINALLGGMMGMNQSNLRAMMAYSSIGHMGWMMALISIQALLYAFIYYLFYVMLIMPIFMLFFFMAAKTLKTSNTMSSLSPLMKVSIMLMLLSLAGLPPFSGFFPKLMALTQLFMYNNYLALTLIIGSLMTLYFYLNVVLVYSMETSKTTLKEPTSGFMMCLISSLMSLIMLPVLILYAMTFFN